ATEKDAQTAADIVEEIDAEDVATAKNLKRNIRSVGLELSKSIASEMLIQGKSEILIQESAQKLYLTLCEIEGLTEDERFCTLNKIPDYPTQMLVFFSLPSSMRLE
ncbi:hypothetical protein Goari_022926, partial [Gossypium aridum]|nr:hypothetical protein [Gossypium aridum]